MNRSTTPADVPMPIRRQLPLDVIRRLQLQWASWQPHPLARLNQRPSLKRAMSKS
jgi:hypothetical protein